MFWRLGRVETALGAAPPGERDRRRGSLLL